MQKEMLNQLSPSSAHATPIYNDIGRVPSRLVLSLLEAYVNEDNYVTWVAIDNCFGKLGLLLSYTDLSEKLNALGIELYCKVFEKLGFDSKAEDTHTENLLRALVLNRLAKFKYEPVLKESHLRFKDHITGKAVHPDIRNCVYRAVASSCDDETFATFFKLYRAADSAEERVRLLQSLGATSDPVRVRQVLQFSLSNEVRYQDAWIGVVSTTGSKVGCNEAWKFFKENANEFKERYGAHISNGRLIKSVISGFASEEASMEIEQFFIQNPFSGHENVILRGLETVKLHADWLKREVMDVKDFFATKYPS